MSDTYFSMNRLTKFLIKIGVINLTTYKINQWKEARKRGLLIFVLQNGNYRAKRDSAIALADLKCH